MKIETLKLIIENVINDTNYKKWKKNNVTYRGIKNLNSDNGVFGSFGKGLYTVPLSNKSMAKQYGDLYYVVNSYPKNPKVVQSLNNAELVRQDLIYTYCKINGVEYSANYFNNNTSMEAEMIKLGYDGLIIKGREIVNYTPSNIMYFKTEDDLINYYENKIF